MPLSPDAPPPIGPRSLALAAAFQGSAAYTAGAPVNACPYGATRPFTVRAWLAGYNAAARKAGATLPGDVADDVDDEAPWPGDTPGDTAAEVSGPKP